MIDIHSADKTTRSIIAEVGEKEILIGFPMDRNIYGMLPEGTKVDLTFFANDNKYKFKTEIIGKKNDNMPLFRISKPSEKEIIKVQDRENFRVRTNLSLLLDDKELHTINISAGGLLFSCVVDLDLKEGEEISGTLVIPSTQKRENLPILFKGQIKRVSIAQEKERKQVAIEFTELHKRDQMKIIQFCFEKQRQIRLKEKQ